jgi:LSD1 subclass zinc finger protein
MATAQWARIRPSETGHLRRGAWYRVIRLTPQEAVLDVNGTLTAFPRPSLEILPTRPMHWTVVPRPPRSARLPITWGACYAVCPNCRERARIDDGATSLRCPKCNGFFDIGWDNS